MHLKLSKLTHENLCRLLTDNTEYPLQIYGKEAWASVVLDYWFSLVAAIGPITEVLVEITASHWSEKSDRFECPSVTSQLVWLRMKVFSLQYGCLLDNIFQIIKINYDTGSGQFLVWPILLKYCSLMKGIERGFVWLSWWLGLLSLGWYWQLITAAEHDSINIFWQY